MSTTTIDATHNFALVEAAPTTPARDGSEMRVCSSTTASRKQILEFTLPTFARLLSATLRVYYEGPDGAYPPLPNLWAFRTPRVVTHDVTWNNYDAANALGMGGAELPGTDHDQESWEDFAAVGAAGSWVDIPVTKQVLDAGPGGVYRALLCDSPFHETATEKRGIFTGATGANHPQLVLVTEDSMTVLRIYKTNISPPINIGSSTDHGYSDLRSTRVRNDLGALDFQLTGTTPALVAEWITELSEVLYFVNDVCLGSYWVDEYSMDWVASTARVSCRGMLASPNFAPYTARTFSRDTAAGTIRDLLRTSGGNALIAPALDEAHIMAGCGVLWEDDGRDEHGDPRTEDPPAAPWSVAVDSDLGRWVSEGLVAYLTTGQATGYKTTGFTARADMYVQATVAQAPIASNDIGLLARWVSSTSGYMVTFSATTGYFYQRAATWVMLGSFTYSALAAHDLIAFSVVGSTLTAYINDVAVGTVSDATVTAAGYAGVRFYNGAATANYLVVTNFAVCPSAPPNVPSLTYSAASAAQVLKDVCELAHLSAWVDGGSVLNAEIVRTAVDKTYTINSTLHECEFTHHGGGICNSAYVVSGAFTGDASDVASMVAYGICAEWLNIPSLGSNAQCAAYAAAYVAERKDPRPSVRVSVDHDATLREGLFVKLDGLGDGKTHEYVIEQITYREGDLWDELVLGRPPTVLKDAV
jgi:hypothetical protein